MGGGGGETPKNVYKYHPSLELWQFFILLLPWYFILVAVCQLLLQFYSFIMSYLLSPHLYHRYLRAITLLSLLSCLVLRRYLSICCFIQGIPNLDTLVLSEIALLPDLRCRPCCVTESCIYGRKLAVSWTMDIGICIYHGFFNSQDSYLVL